MKRYYSTLQLFFIFVLIGITPLPASISTPYASEIDAVIFDCDGVLVDTEYLKFLSWQKALLSENIDFVIEEYMPLVGHSSQNILIMLKELKGIDIPETVIELKYAHYRVLQKQGVPPIQEMVAFARSLTEKKKELRIKVGLASSAPTEEILRNLQQIGLENAFDFIISGSDDLNSYVDDRGTNKPMPYIYLEAAKQLNVLPSKCLVFKDTNAGVEAAASAGMIVVAVPNQCTFQQDFSRAITIIESHADLKIEDFQ